MKFSDFDQVLQENKYKNRNKMEINNFYSILAPTEVRMTDNAHLVGIPDERVNELAIEEEIGQE